MGNLDAAENLETEKLKGPQSQIRPASQPEAVPAASEAALSEPAKPEALPKKFSELSDQEKMEFASAKIDSGEVDGVLSDFDTWLQHPDNVESGIKAASTLDAWKPVRKFRDFWDKRSAEVQWAIMKTTSLAATGAMAPLALWYNVGPIQSLIKMGVITYKGHIGEDGRVMEDKITAMGGIEKVMLNGGLKVASGIASIGKYVYPELAIVEFVEKLSGPAKSILNSTGGYMEKVRAGVYENRAALRTAQTERKAITNETRYQLTNVLAAV